MSEQQNHYLELMAIDVTEFVPNDPIYGFYCPESWEKQLSTGDRFYNIKLSPIGDELNLLYPELLNYSFKRKALAGKSPIFYSLTSLPVAEIHEHFIRHVKLSKKDFQLKEMGKWKILDVCSQRSLLFEWLPEFFARKFVQQEPRFKIRDRKGDVVAELDFYLVNKDGQAGCMTRPYEIDGKYFSYAVYFSIQTFPRRPERYYLFVKPVLHRYISRSVNDHKLLRSIKGTSIFVRLNRSLLYPFVSLKTKKAKSCGENALMKWENPEVVEYLNQFCEKPLSWEALLKDPALFMSPQKEVSALILYNPNTFVKDRDIIASGLGLPDRRRLYELVREKLLMSPSLITTHTIMNKTNNLKFFPLVTPQPLKIDIQCHVSQSHFDALIQTLQKREKNSLSLSMGCERSGEYSYKLNTDQYPLFLRLRHIPESHVVQEINQVDPSRTITEMGRFIKSCIKQGDHLNAAIVEIRDKDKWSYDQIDPKEYVRYAFWKEEILTQFMTDEEESLLHRAHSAISDLLKDFGVFRQCLKSESSSKWLFVRGSGKKKHPKVWLARFKDNHVDYCLQDAHLGWQSVRELVLNAEGLRRSLNYRRSTRNKQDFVNYIEDILEKELEGDCKNLFVVFDRGTLTRFYDPVQNKHLTEGRWRFERESLRKDPRLKIIRMSDSTFEGVPEYISRTRSKTFDHFASGLYKMDEIYYSLGPKGDTIRFSPIVERSFTIDKFLRQPNLQEFYPVGINWDEKEKTDAVIQLHRWRRASVTFKHATIFPAPMHTLGTIEKYMSMILTVEANFEKMAIK